jgi:ubiquinone/menaquinone biosynthesis C-methylase UbiE
MSASQSIYHAPFDSVAGSYDEAFTSSKIGQAQRVAVWSELAQTFCPGGRVLEIGCGTGVDACFLAEKGIHVLACDSSSQMIEVARRRVQEHGLQELVRPLLIRAEDIATLPPRELFDGAYSNFGALNCVENLPQLARDLARLLKPGANAILCWMGPSCLWEMLWYLAQGNRRKAFRRLHHDGVTARLADEAFVHVRYPSVKSLAAAFAPEFRLKSVKGIGVAVPPSYVEDWAKRHPNLLRLCERLDAVFGHCPGVRVLADHILVRLQREAER